MLKMVIQKSVYIVQMLLNMDGWMSLKIKLSPLKWLYATGMVKLITLDVYYQVPANGVKTMNTLVYNQNN
mgnify:FL=1